MERRRESTPAPRELDREETAQVAGGRSEGGCILPEKLRDILKTR